MLNRYQNLVLYSMTLLGLPSVVLAQSMPVSFTDVSSLLDFEHNSSEAGGNGLSGAAWFDYDGDGWIDLFIPNGRDHANALFRNMGDGTFADNATAAGVDTGLGYAGAIAADFDNDGWTDLFLTGEQGRGAGWYQGPAKMYRNNGNGTFTDVTGSTGIVGPAAHRTASAADIDNDGLLDLLIAGNTTTTIQLNKMYRNQGGFQFADISASSGLNTSQSSCASMFSDYDDDGDQDLYMASCTTQTPMDLFRNNGDNTFSDVGLQAGFSSNALFMGICGADYDHDGDIDIFSTNYASGSGLPHALYRNDGDGTFTDVAVAAGVAIHEFGWGCSFTDYDNDGHDDLFFTGSLDTTCQDGISGCPDFETIGAGRGNHGTMLFNDGSGSFSDYSNAMPVDMTDLYTSGVAHADFDQNGFIDVLTVAERVPAQHGRSTASGKPILYRNEGNANNWATIRLRGTASNRDAIGARVILQAGGFAQAKEVYAGSSHLTTESAWLTFGLGDNTEIDAVTVRWPSGLEEDFRNLATNRVTVLTEGTSVGTQNPLEIPERAALHQNYPNPVKDLTTIRVALSEAGPLTLVVYDLFGREVETLYAGNAVSGLHEFTFEVGELANGVYMYRLDTGRESQTRSMSIVR